ncbi:MAG: NAD(P) transhydrogenase subunit alpha [Pirellulaceae bacterium]|nr:NAD(P) transhydrogenase subunit alpha [Pirellulaceae bacterium]
MRSGNHCQTQARPLRSILFPICCAVLLGGIFVGLPSIRLQAAEQPLTQVETAEETIANEFDLGFNRRDALIASVTIFVLSIFVGFELITKVPPTLHTPLMSGSNAISGITVVGALLAAGLTGGKLAGWLGMLAVMMATINVVGGFLVTHRMLSMFRRR